MINQSLRWYSMPLIDEQVGCEDNSYFKKGISSLEDGEATKPDCPGQARSLEDMLRAPSSFPALILPTAVVKRSSLLINEAEVPTRVAVKSNGIEFQEVTLRSLNDRPLGINVEINTRISSKSVFHEVFIKQIYPKGIAYLDGRLKIGDRIIKVNDKIVGNDNLAPSCYKQVWTMTIARRVGKVKVKSGFSCGIVQKRKTRLDTHNKEIKQLLCTRFLEGLDMKKVFKELERAKKKHIWENITTTCMEFEDLLIKSHDYLNRTKNTEKINLDTNDTQSKQLQIFYPQQQLFSVKPLSVSSQQDLLHSPIPLSSASDI